MVIQWAARLCSALPPGHVGQDRIIAFLEALRDLPRHEVAKVVFPTNEGEIVENMFQTMEVWLLDGRWLSLQEEFRELDLRWRNFQSAMARIKALNLINCEDLCALEMILPFDGWYPDLNDGKAEGFHWIAGQVIASVQWILRPEVGRYVYRECRKFERIVSDWPRVVWSMERWQQWKDQFEFVAREERRGGLLGWRVNVWFFMRERA
ncbi:hypothetical protein BO71DRAFT_485099 [Aspergillus ellipticus CBS 707.79]|uniref:Uncharacterized protein n=1 Tax=Aspergillus ellipticus CBS 707.79 TaxID=1448320 RepID=A0A319DX83_9EURO|nr:hypothetical protein BO71DRAFT_485099 [Aspergillus ellipticus CBS 707.79]